MQLSPLTLPSQWALQEKNFQVASHPSKGKFEGSGDGAVTGKSRKGIADGGKPSRKMFSFQPQLYSSETTVTPAPAQKTQWA